MLADIISAIIELDFQGLNEILVEIDMLTLLKNPYVILFMVCCCIIFIIGFCHVSVCTRLSCALPKDH